MERSLSGHYIYDDDDFVEDRRSRVLHTDNGHGQRAASQPPHSPTTLSSPPNQHFLPSSLGGPWSSSRMLSPNRGQPVPIRSSSFSSHPQSQFGSVMRDRTFPSTFEDDESEAFSDTYDFLPSLGNRGRTYAQDPSRSRSQSLATGRQGAVGTSPYLGSSAMQSWNESYMNSTQRYGAEIKPPTSRYGSLGTLGSSPTVGTRGGDISNMSPFVRDVGQIVLDDGSAFRDLWNRDDNGGGSGTTSRRHSVSVVQPRRGNVIGFNAPGADLDDPQPRSSFQPAYSGRSGLMLSDDDLASDLNLLNLNTNESSSSQHPPSQPSSLPIYAPLSRSPPSRDLMSAYQSINLTIPNSYSRQAIGTPSDTSGNSPPRGGVYEQHLAETHSRQQQQQHQELTARFIPGQGIQYVQQQQQYVRARAPSQNTQSPISPTRAINPQQPPFFPQTQRRLSDAHHQQPQTPNTPQNLSDLGKGVPLHAVPSSCPLFIVEFKAGRTDLFYLTDLSQDIRVGDLVIVEADRGKDLGKVVNDSITLAEVELFQRERKDQERGFGSQTGATVGANSANGNGAGANDEAVSPGGVPPTPGGKKEINPKMIYTKASAQDVQMYATKTQDEHKALQLCQSKVRAKKLPMEVVDAEYQWDRRKLTFYFIAEKRIDFRELVRELFRLYKTRIWMASLQGGISFEQ